MAEYNSGFIDYYELMRISPNAEVETIQRVFGLLSTRFHPDNPETGDPETFVRLTSAYEVLSDPAKRAGYDRDYQFQHNFPLDVFRLREFTTGIDGEANRRMGVLCLLYNRRRTNPERPGISLLEFEVLMSFPREHLTFTLWYLREKNCVRQDETSNFLITGEGIDYVEAHLASYDVLYKLLQAAERGESRGAARMKSGGAATSERAHHPA